MTRVEKQISAFLLVVLSLGLIGCSGGISEKARQAPDDQTEWHLVQPSDPIANVLNRYYEEEDINGRLKWVANPEKARPFMEDYYKSDMDQYGTMAGTKLLSVRCNVANLAKLALGRKFSVKFKGQSDVDDYKKIHEVTYPMVKTKAGYRIDWLAKFVGKMASDDSVPEISAKQLEAVPERYRNKQVKLLWTLFDEINNDSVDLLPSVRISTNGLLTKYDKSEADKWFGFRVWDKTEKGIPFLFAKKSEFVDQFLEFDQYDFLNITGVVVELENTNSHGIIVTEVEKINF